MTQDENDGHCYGPEPLSNLEKQDRRESAERLDIEDVPKLIEKLRTELLVSIDASDSDAEAEQHFLLALSSLEQAERFAKLAVYRTRQLRAAFKGSWP